MKVTGIKHEKHKCDGAGIERVIIDYEIGNTAKTATIYYDVYVCAGSFGTNEDYKEHKSAMQALMGIADSYMDLVEYGWEG